MSDTFPVLTGDIGGTNARFEWVASKSSAPRPLGTVKTAEFEGPEAAIAQCLSDAGLSAPKSALLAAAGPITDEGLDLTNCHWVIRPQDFLRRTNISRLQLLNDFEAQALALPFFAASDLLPIGETAKSLPHLDDTVGFSKAVLGPGTGLGVGLMIRAQGKWVPVPGEGGHVDLGPRSAFENEIWPHLEPIEGRVSGEQILSGRGLENLHRAVLLATATDDGLRTAPEITERGMADDRSTSARTLNLFCTFLGRVAGDLALVSMAYGGVYLAGGIVKKIAPFVQSSHFRAAFEDKAPHGALMRSMPTWLVEHELPALLGLAHLAQTPDHFLMDLDHRSWEI